MGPANIGGLFRICDAFGIEKLVFNTQVDVSSPRLKKTARSTYNDVFFEIQENLPTYIKTLKNNSYLVIGLEITSNSKPVQTQEIPEGSKVALVIGNEQHGLSEAVLQSLDSCVHIEMFGANSSMNVTQATAIALYELTKS